MTGIRIILSTTNDDELADITVPGGSSWLDKSGKKWVYADKTGSVGGITKVQIADRSAKAPKQLKIQIKGINGTYEPGPGDEPFKTTIVVGSGALGECGEKAFEADQCVFAKNTKSVLCK
jgi:hypothetical protein